MELETFRALLGPQGQRLLGSLAAYEPGEALAVATRLRPHHPSDLVAAALTQARLRARAREKFGDVADLLYFTPDGLEQATRRTVADHRARRFVASGALRVADLGCGIGGDLLAFATAGLGVLAVERDPLAAEVAAANAAVLGLTDRVTVRCGDLTRATLTGCDAAFLDPSRRTGRGRVFDPDAYSPPWSFVEELPRRFPRTAAKVAPGVPHVRVPAGAEAEWVSDGGHVKEAALWFGDLATARRRATLLPEGVTLADDTPPGVTGTPPVRDAGRYLYEPDGAVIRAGLVAEVATRVGGWLVDRSIAYVSADRLVQTPFATAYEITDVLPFGLKRLRALLRDRGVGQVTIKKRGSAVDTERLRGQLRPSGPHGAVVILTRVAGRPTVLLCHRAQHSGSARRNGGPRRID
ncbi:MAG: class I SAM-dependent methyltransferase [Carbonactinosporaceae bacterium]